MSSALLSNEDTMLLSLYSVPMWSTLNFPGPGIHEVWKTAPPHIDKKCPPTTMDGYTGMLSQ